jgi:hypothetical protein
MACSGTAFFFTLLICPCRIYGPVRIQGQWRLRTNAELDNLLGHADLVRFVRFQVLTAASMMFRAVGRQSFYTAVQPRRQL